MDSPCCSRWMASPILLDTGQTGTAVHNARALGVDLSRVKHIVLSHGHQDHTGGLRDVLAQTGEVDVYAHSELWRPRSVFRKGEKPRYSGLPFVRDQLEMLGATFRLSDDPQTIFDRDHDHRVRAAKDVL